MKNKLKLNYGHYRLMNIAEIITNELINSNIVKKDKRLAKIGYRENLSMNDDAQFCIYETLRTVLWNELDYQQIKKDK